ncbi:hypothetical protein H4S08_004838 [Coemansia sp. RSA 1365]|nr:hypothetical protein H4S08_004838 [Coemansia sp. RSA 1365]
MDLYKIEVIRYWSQPRDNTDIQQFHDASDYAIGAVLNQKREEADALSQQLKALMDAERGYRYMLDLRPAIRSKDALFEKDTTYHAAAKASRVVEQPAAMPIVATTVKLAAVPVTVLLLDVIRDAVDIAEGHEHAGNNSDSSGVQMLNAVCRAMAIAEGQDVTMDNLFKSARKELEYLGVNDLLNATADDWSIWG